MIDTVFRFPARLTLIVFMILSVAGGVAFPVSADVTVTPLTVEGFVKGKRYKIGAEFAEKYEIAVPAPFQFIAPTYDNHLNYIQPAPGGTGVFKVSFVTLEKAVKSNIQFVPLVVGEGTLEQQIESLKPVLFKAFAGMVPDKDRAEIQIKRATKVGPYEALEIIGRYDGGADGLVILRVVGIINPDSKDGMFVAINALVKNLQMQTIEDILKTDASRALGTFRFE